MKVKEVAELVGISVRTLHHYDEIGLLIPRKQEMTGYRFYTDDDLEKLQQILFYRELGFSLKKIKEIITSPNFNREEAYTTQLRMLNKKRHQLNQMIATLEKTIQHMKGEITMSNKDKFLGFDFSHNPYEEEARERWGDKAIDESNKRLGEMSQEEKKGLAQDMESIFIELAKIRHLSPEAKEAQATIHEWYQYLSKINDYSLDAFKGLGEMYVADERFTKNIDKFGEGLAKFMCEAMTIYVEKQR